MRTVRVTVALSVPSYEERQFSETCQLCFYALAIRIVRTPNTSPAVSERPEFRGLPDGGTQFDWCGAGNKGHRLIAGATLVSCEFAEILRRLLIPPFYLPKLR